MELVSIDKVKRKAIKTPLNALQVYKFCKEMEEVCVKNNGVGLNAIQVGLPWNLFVIKKDNSFEYYANCTYKPIGSETVTSIEGCLSIPDEEGNLRRFEVKRYLIVDVNGFKLVESKFGLTFETFRDFIHAEDLGIVFQHEIDHSSGILISDIGKEILIW